MQTTEPVGAFSSCFSATRIVTYRNAVLAAHKQRRVNKTGELKHFMQAVSAKQQDSNGFTLAVPMLADESALWNGEICWLNVVVENL